MKILFLGDIVGRSGRNKVCDLLNSLKEKYNIDFTIVNGENSAHGKGITESIYNQLITAGVDAITMGNHTYSKKEIRSFIDLADKLVVPYNIVDKKGEGYRIFNVDGVKICVINFLGKELMGDYVDDPYTSMNQLITQLNKEDIDIKIMDFHAETTAEKRIFFEIFKEYIDVFIGTHTHIQTADDTLINGKAYITDVGMCGPYNSIIGRDINESVQKYIYQVKTHYTVSEDDAIICGCVIEIKDKKIVGFERIQIRP